MRPASALAGDWRAVSAASSAPSTADSQAHPDGGELAQPLAQRVLAIARLVPQGLERHGNQPRRPTLAQTVRRLRPLRQGVSEASQLLSDDLLQDVPIERQVRDDLLQFAVFVA